MASTPKTESEIQSPTSGNITMPRMMDAVHKMQDALRSKRHFALYQINKNADFGPFIDNVMKARHHDPRWPGHPTRGELLLAAQRGALPVGEKLAAVHLVTNHYEELRKRHEIRVRDIEDVAYATLGNIMSQPLEREYPPRLMVKAFEILQSHAWKPNGQESELTIRNPANAPPLDRYSPLFGAMQQLAAACHFVKAGGMDLTDADMATLDGSHEYAVHRASRAENFLDRHPDIKNPFNFVSFEPDKDSYGSLYLHMDTSELEMIQETLTAMQGQTKSSPDLQGRKF